MIDAFSLDLAASVSTGVRRLGALHKMAGVLTLVALVQCGDAPTQVCRAPVSALSPTANSMQVGDTAAFTATYPLGCAVGQTTWSAVPPDVVTLQVAAFPGKSANVIAVSPGTVTIKAATNDGSRTSTLTVSAIPVLSVNVLTSARLGVGKSQGAAVELRSVSGKLLTDAWYACTWQSSNTGVATVSLAGNNGANSRGATIVGVAPGTVALTVSCAGVSGTIVLTVETPPSIPVASVVVQGAGTVVVGQTTRLTAEPANAGGIALQLTDRSVEWQSSDNSIATVLTDPVTLQGVVTGQQSGVVTIRAVVDNVVGARVIVVEPPALKKRRAKSTSASFQQ